MIVVQGSNNNHAILQAYSACIRSSEVTIRGQKCRNVRDMAIVLDARTCPLTTFRERNLNLLYAKKEMLWYLGADPKDDSITEYATMWKKLQQEDGTFHSNYGQYIFKGGHLNQPSQFAYVASTLAEDPQSRRATMVLLQPYHLFRENSDVVCTYALQFTIEDGHLYMTVLMRSNDIVFGFTNDAFCFWNIIALLHAVLLKKYPDLKLGTYTHFAGSMHVYERHYEMLRKITASPNGDSVRVDVPLPTTEEAVDLVKSNGVEGDGEYTRWLKAES